jgi:membrane protein DedA with SNARE-associated domain
MISVILEAISNFILLVIQKIGYLGIFFLMLLQSLNVPIPSEITMSFSGFLAQAGVFNFWLVVFVGAFANLVGALLSYKLASFLGSETLRNKYKILKILISDRGLGLAQEWFKKYGAISVFFSRMVPVVSTFISFPAGLARMNLKIFSILTLAGSFIWCLFLTYLGFVFGENWTILQVYFRKFDYVILLLILAAIGWWLWRRFKNRKLQLE